MEITGYIDGMTGGKERKAITPEERAEKIVSEMDFGCGCCQDQSAGEQKALIAGEIRAAVEEEIRERLSTLEYAKVRDAKAEAYEEVRRFIDEKLNNAGNEPG